MSAAEHQSRNVSSQSGKKSLNNPPQRPSLLQPPPRPAAPASKPSETNTEASKPAQHPVKVTAAPAVSQAQVANSDMTQGSFKNHPIAPPSEPMQYRAIGLVQGVYQPSEEQLNRGNILADDGAVIDAVLLGRVTSLIKKHIDLESSHLWVVYPRTRQFQEETEEATPEGSSGALHLQIVGVWEPETLGLPGENPHTSDEEKEAGDTPASSTEMETGVQPPAKTEVTAERPADNYFSIRGEIINYDEEKESILVKIVQGAKRSGKPPKAFKLNVLGKISGKTVGYFWELDVQRQGEELVLTEGRPVGIVPPKKKKKGKFSKPRRGGHRPGQSMDYKSSRPTRTKEKPRIRPSAPVKSNPL